MNIDSNLNNKNSDTSKNELAKQNSSTSSSASSSIYSSPSGTPIGQKETENRIASNNGQKEEEQKQHQNQSSPILSSKEKENNHKYEELVKLTKIQMANKFDQLEKETEFILKQKDNNLIKNFQYKNDCSMPLSSNNSNFKVTELSSPVKKSQHSDYLAMEKEIKRLKTELNVKNEIINKMCNIRTQVESELEDLTASLFEEANKMVYDANILRDKAEKELYEATFKIDMLTAEVQALKLMVITSTPSKPNTHLHPHLNSKSNSNDKKNSRQFLIPKKSPSNYELGNKEQMIDTNNKNDRTLLEYDDDKEYYDKDSIGEIDPIFFEEFNEWRKCPTLEPMNSNFIKRIYDEEIYPVFNFKNKHLTSLVLRSIENNTLTVETIKSDKLPFPKKCALMEASRICRYRMKIEDQQWHYISQLCRNRITTICDLFCYLRYIQDGLVKSNSKEIFWHIMKRRRNIALSKLGFIPIS